MKKLLIALLITTPVQANEALKDNLAYFCYEIAMHRDSNFSAFDYKSSYMAHSNGRATFMLRHEDYSSVFLKCRYTPGKVHWNTLTTSGHFTVDSNFDKKKANYRIK
jgi:hypothetical protein